VAAFLPPPPSPPPAKKGGDKKSPVAYIAAGAAGLVLSAAAAAIYVRSRRRTAVTPISELEGAPPSKKQRKISPDEPQAAGVVSPRATRTKAAAVAKSPMPCWLPMPPAHPASTGGKEPMAAVGKTVKLALRRSASSPLKREIRPDGESDSLSPYNRARAALDRSRSSKRNRPPSSSSSEASMATTASAGRPAVPWLALPLLPDTGSRKNMEAPALPPRAAAAHRALAALPALPALQPSDAAAKPELFDGHAASLQAEEVDLRPGFISERK